MSAPTLYVDRETFLHALDPRAKVVLVVGLFVAAYVFTDPVFVAVPFLVALLSLWYAGGLGNLLRLWFVLVMLFLVGFVVWPLYAPARGPVVLATPVLSITEHQFLFALGRSTRIIAFIVAGFAFITTTSNEEIVRGMRGFRLPFAFCFAVGTALRLFPTFLGATGTVKQAQEARGLDLSEGGPIQRIRNYVPLLIPVLMTAIRQVNTQAMALEARGFDAGRGRTFYAKEPFGAADWIATVAGVAIALGTVAARLLGFGVL